MELKGWKAIAADMGKSPRMCRYYLRWNPPIPVYQFGNGEVMARSEELALFRKVHLRHCGARLVASRCQRLPGKPGKGGLRRTNATA